VRRSGRCSVGRGVGRSSVVVRGRGKERNGLNFVFFGQSSSFVGRTGGNERRRAHLEIGKAYDAPEIVEYGDLRYRRRVETRNALPG